MNESALNGVAIEINGLGKIFETKSLYYWLRNTMTVATCDALLGSHNLLKTGSDLVDALWYVKPKLQCTSGSFFSLLQYICGIQADPAPECARIRGSLRERE